MAVEPLLTKVWLGVGTKGFVFPELRDDDEGIKAVKMKPDFAVCLSGGGLRAASCAVGWIQALHDLEILPKVRYLCSNSGGSWFNACFSYQEHVPLDVFLGPYIPPEELTKQRLKQHAPGSFASVIDKARFAQHLRRNLLIDALYCDCLRAKDKNHQRAWTRAVGSQFLQTHKLYDLQATFALKGSSELRAKLSGAKQVFTAMRSDTMPFPIMVGCALPRNDHRRNFSLEFTPLYCGAPIRVEDVHELKIGGNLVEPFAFCSEAPDDLNPFEGDSYEPRWAKLRPQWPFTVVQAAGISSQAIATTKVTSDRRAMWDLYGCPELPMWSGVDFASIPDMPMGDGGGTDNLAVFPALRRGMTKLLICFASKYSLGMEVEDWARLSTDISSLFGRVPTNHEGMNSKVFNSTQQVFDQAEFDVLHTHVREELAAGRPLIWSRTLRVLPNPTQGVVGGYSARTVWIINGSARQWFQQLPKPTQKVVRKIDHFPLIPTSRLCYDPQTTGALSALSAWHIHEAEGEIRNLLLPMKRVAPAEHHDRGARNIPTPMKQRGLPPHSKAQESIVNPNRPVDILSGDTTDCPPVDRRVTDEDDNDDDDDDGLVEAFLSATAVDVEVSEETGRNRFVSNETQNAGDVSHLGSTGTQEVRMLSTDESQRSRRAAPEASTATSRSRKLKAPTGGATMRKVKSDAPTRLRLSPGDTAASATASGKTQTPRGRPKPSASACTSAVSRRKK
mmetsp:Transcript_69140/g.200206  ORF Transcript_69140/g.200206 Transcript_69140/m.200206 type:complete len:732 (+) Transcript_69140:96-2291(+)